MKLVLAGVAVAACSRSEPPPAAPHTLAAEGRDVYRNFVFPTQLAGPHWVAGWEMRTNGAAIYHAIINVDRHGWARRRDAEDAEPGYPGMDPGDLQAPDGFYLV